MKEVNLNGYRLMLVTVPGNSFDSYHINKSNYIEAYPLEGERLIMHGDGGLYIISWCSDDLPPGYWQILGSGLASEIRDGDIPEGMVKPLKDNTTANLYFDYEQNRWLYTIDRSASLCSFVRSHGMDPERTVIIYEPKNKANE